MLRNINKTFPMWIRRISLSHQKKKVYEINGNIEFNDKVMNGKGTVVVNFHADWCDPCTILTPKLIELIEPIETLDLAIINLESNPDLADVFSVKAVPAVFAISNGLVLDKFIGLQDIKMIEQFVEKLTARDTAVNSKIEDNSVNLKVDDSTNSKDGNVKP
ncbi:PREDICTED: thioredoxin, mitochondrial [Polistes dominula]|uniref:Thioredoxin, mitochondrial n=1 Tax=Polistes dominula TaxID=743375 RepID=A0ABM1II41_POLDO|nr:PREDICTED: thioredoxin, mitochondrial [Polistes dominula]XP_015179879.1 PREDICTED: thioredoxin, mitochondrial [Polistes dominula]